MNALPYTDADQANFIYLLDLAAISAPFTPRVVWAVIHEHLVIASLQSPPIDLLGLLSPNLPGDLDTTP